jgi:hypothetical protein
MQQTAKLTSLRVLVSELGELCKSRWSGEALYYSAKWEEIRGLAEQAARRQKIVPPDDVRFAGYALDIAGIPREYAEAGQDDQGNWIVYWR